MGDAMVDFVAPGPGRVTADGGPLSHAAVLARELGIPAVVGARGVIDLPDGAEVEVDPIAGTVRQVSSVSSVSPV